MKIRNVMKRLEIFFARRAARLPIHKHALTTAREGPSALFAHKENGPPDAAPVMESQGRFEKGSSAVNLIQPIKSKDSSTGGLNDLLAGECNKRNLTKFTLATHANLGNNITQLNICVFAAQQDWHSNHTNAASTSRGNTGGLHPPRNDNGTANDSAKSACSNNNVKQISSGKGTVSDSANPSIIAAQEQTRASSATSSSGMPYVGGGTVVMRVPPMSVSSSSRLGSSTSFKAGNSTSSLNSSTEGEGTDHQGGKQKPQCHLCGSSFTRRNDLTRHLANVHGDKGCVCRSCGLQLSRPDAVKRHEDSGACGKRSSRQSGQDSTGSR